MNPLTSLLTTTTHRLWNETYPVPPPQHIPHLILPYPPPDHINLTALILAHRNCWNVTPYQCPLLFFFSNESSYLHPPCPSIQMPLGNYISMLLYSIVGIVGLVGNTLVIYVVLRFSKMQTVTNIYILNLAFADECFLIGIPFLLATISLGEWPFGSVTCKAFMVSTSITQFTSSIFLFIMSADRYLGECAGGVLQSLCKISKTIESQITTLFQLFVIL